MSVEKEIELIKKRNKHVEADKAWETSKTRKIIVAGVTYFLVVLFLYIIDVQNPFLNAIVPTLGFILSTLTIPVLKKIWIKKVYK